jgi:flavin-dependent dehydrogenase
LNLAEPKHIIIGSGPAGVSTWLFLHKYSPALAAQTLVIEKLSHPRKKLCGGGISTPGMDLLDQLSVTLDFPYQRITKMQVRLENETLHLPSPPGMIIVERSVFDHTLVKKALALGMRLHEDESFVNIKRDGENILVQTDKAMYKTKALIGADGARSMVRRKMNLNEKQRISRLLEVHTPDTTMGQRDTIIIDFTAKEKGLQGYSWRFPCFMDDEPAYNYGVYDSQVHENTNAPSLKEVLNETFKEEIEDAVLEGHPLRYFHKDAVYSQPNILLTGDALGVDPALGEGISVSLHYGKIAAHALFLAAKNNNYSFTDYKDLIYTHPLGNALERQYALAVEMYKEGGGGALKKVFC